MTLMTQPTLFQALTSEELAELNAFLASPMLEKTSMNLPTLHGYFVALTMGPGMVLPTQWMPLVWDMRRGGVSPDFTNVEEANRIINILMRYYNGSNCRSGEEGVIDGLEGIFRVNSVVTLAEWCEGFMLGASFLAEQWAGLVADRPDWFDAIVNLASAQAEGRTNALPDDDVDRWRRELAPALKNILAYWRDNRQFSPASIVQEQVGVTGTLKRDAPKVGRNDPCSCGSGKKYKKCCGAG